MLDSLDRFLSRQPRSDQLGNKRDQALFETLSERGDASTLSSLWATGNSLAERHRDYREMEQHSLVKAAATLIADDSTQPDPEGRKFWLSVKKGVKDREKVLKAWEEFYQEFEIDDSCWSWAYTLTLHGHAPVQLEYSKDKGLISVSDPMPHNVVRYEYNRRPIAFAKVESIGGRVETFHHPYEFVSFAHRGKSEEYQDGIKLRRRKVQRKNSKNPPPEEIVKIYATTGHSPFDAARNSWKRMQTTEDFLLMSRVTRSPLVRLFFLKATGGRSDIGRRIRKIRNVLSRSSRLSKGDGYASAMKGMSMVDEHFIPTDDVQGDVRIEELGGNVDVKSIADLDHFRNNFFGTINVPKAFLGFEEELPGGMNNASLTRLDIRYAREVKKVKSDVASGIKRLFQLFYGSRYGAVLDPSTYFVKGTPISTAEDNEMVDNLDGRIQTADSLSRLIDDTSSVGAFVKDKRAFVEYIFKTVLNLPDLEVDRILYGEGEKPEKDDKDSSNRFGSFRNAVDDDSAYQRLTEVLSNPWEIYKGQGKGLEISDNSPECRSLVAYFREDDTGERKLFARSAVNDNEPALYEMVG